MTTLDMKAVRAVPLLNGIWLEKSGDLHRTDVLGWTRDPAWISGEPALGDNEYVLFIKNERWNQMIRDREWWQGAREDGLVDDSGWTGKGIAKLEEFST